MREPHIRLSARHAASVALWRRTARFGLLAWHAYDVATPGLTDRSGRLKAPDFLQFYTYGALVAEHQTGRLYDADAHAAIARRLVDPRLVLTSFTPNYSPVIAWLAVPLTGLPFATAMVAFSAFSAWTLWRLDLAARKHHHAGQVRRHDRPCSSPRRFRRCSSRCATGRSARCRCFVLTAATVAAARGRRGLPAPPLACSSTSRTCCWVRLLILAVARQWRVVGWDWRGGGRRAALRTWRSPVPTSCASM